MGRVVKLTLLSCLCLVALATVLAESDPARGAEEAAEETNQRPPPIVLRSKAGRQRAVEGSFCVSTGEVGLCADAVDPEPRRLSIVRPRERIRISVQGATSVRGSAVVYARGCENRILRAFGLSNPTRRWIVRLRPGKYELEISIAHFTTADGRTGGTSGALGLLVSRTRTRDVVPARSALACPD